MPLSAAGREAGCCWSPTSLHCTGVYGSQCSVVPQRSASCFSMRRRMKHSPEQGQVVKHCCSHSQQQQLPPKCHTVLWELPQGIHLQSPVWLRDANSKDPKTAKFSRDISSGMSKRWALAHFAMRKKKKKTRQKPTCMHTVKERAQVRKARSEQGEELHPPGTRSSSASAKIHSIHRRFRGKKGVCQSYHLGTVVA